MPRFGGASSRCSTSIRCARRRCTRSPRACARTPKKLESLLVRVARLGFWCGSRPTASSARRRCAGSARWPAALGGRPPDRRVTAAAFRDRAGIGRNVAIEVLEYFDRVKFTRRVGDAHELLRPAADAFGEG